MGVPRSPGPGEEAWMQSVVVGAVIAATLAAAIPVSAQVDVRDREDVIIRDHEHGSNHHRAGIATMPNAALYASERTCRTER